MDQQALLRQVCAAAVAHTKNLGYYDGADLADLRSARCYLPKLRHIDPTSAREVLINYVVATCARVEKTTVPKFATQYLTELFSLLEEYDDLLTVDDSNVLAIDESTPLDVIAREAAWLKLHGSDKLPAFMQEATKASEAADLPEAEAEDTAAEDAADGKKADG